MTKNPITLIRIATRWLTYDVWRLTIDNVSVTLRYLINIVKALFLSVRFFVNDRMMMQASALTYYTLLSVVPLFALILGIAKGFNVQDMLQQSLSRVDSNSSETLTYILSFADSYLEHSKTGVIMGIGIVMLLWVIYSLIGNIETVFNQIWQQKKSRSTVRKLTDYLSIMIIIPLLVFIVCGVQIFTHTILHSSMLDATLSQTLAWILRCTPYLLIIIVFTLTYMVIPNVKVKFINALIAGAVAGTGFLAFQNLYLNGQIWVSKYSAIYGSFAALPLLLLWIQMSWVICLYGAELSFASQNVRIFDFENDTNNISRKYYDFLCFVITGLIYSQFPWRKYTTEDISGTLKLPAKLTSNIVNHLRDLGVIDETVSDNGHELEHCWDPGRATDQYTLGQLLTDINAQGSSDFRIDYSTLFKQQWDTLQQMHEASRTVGDRVLVRDFKLDTAQLEKMFRSI